MAINMKQVRALCSKSEKDLFDSSSAKQIKTLTPARLKIKVERSRKLRDKYRDLAEKQRREMRGKQPSHKPGKAQSNDATRTKQQLFQELMERFQAALKDAEAKSASPGKKAVRKAGTKKAVTKKASTKKPAAKKASATKSKASKKKVAQKGSTGKAVVSKEIQAKKAGTKKAAPKKVVARKVAKKKTKRKTTLSEIAKPGRIDRKYKEASTMKIQGHVSSRGRRNQAKRDSGGGR